MNIIINDLKDAILVLVKEADEMYYVQIFDILTKKQTVEIPIKGNYIRCEDIQMNESMDNFALPYLDDGYWHLLVFDLQKTIINLNVNELFNIPNYTLPISGYYAPFATCCFLMENQIYYNFFSRKTKFHSHFIYDYQ